LTASRARIVIGVIGSLLLASLASLPVRADTASELDAARDRLRVIQADLNRLAGEYASAVGRHVQTQDRIAQTQDRIGRVRARMKRIRRALADRAREAYESGGAGTIELLLGSDSFSEFSDRVEYLGRIAKSDADLLDQSRVDGEELRRLEADLARLSKQQAATIAVLARQRAAMGELFAEQRALEARLADRLAAERAAEAARRAAEAAALARQVRGGPLLACPVGQPRAFGNDFGNPRPGGRRHQGIDMVAPHGTPVYASQTGRFQQNYNDLGGISALVFAGNGDYTYYAHLSSYAGVPNGSSVPAGTMIGHVGDTGNAEGGIPHLHFEYHPGGGGATNPYQMLVTVCG
jgi:murein DD-endopeptidase MepM/ murein hydrolase activator NlpD